MGGAGGWRGWAEPVGGAASRTPDRVRRFGCGMAALVAWGAATGFGMPSQHARNHRAASGGATQSISTDDTD
ncbi:hypothetical protein GCM10025734_31360 [Kitasatospora paranensis]